MPSQEKTILTHPKYLQNLPK